MPNERGQAHLPNYYRLEVGIAHRLKINHGRLVALGVEPAGGARL
jgi:hypothetical protein